mgnify:CR=1 FL=1
MLEHIDRAIHEDGHKTRELIRQLMIHTERKLEAMAIDTKAVLAKLQAQSTQIDGVLALCDTLHTHLHDVIDRLNAQGVNTADLQAMSDLLDQQGAKIATAITSDADISEVPPAPAPVDPAPAPVDPAPAPVDPAPVSDAAPSA